MIYKSYDHRKRYGVPRYIHQQSGKCSVKSVVADDVIDAIIHALKLYINDFELKISNCPKKDESDINMRIDLMRNEIAKTERKISKLFDSWESDTITNNEFIERKHIHNVRIEKLKTEIENLENIPRESEDYKEKTFLLSEALDAIKDSSLDATIKNEYLKRIISKIEYSRENDHEFILDIDLHNLH